MVKPFALEQRGYPINQPINHAGGGAVDDDGACDFEHISADAQDIPLCCCQYRTQSFAKKATVWYNNSNEVIFT